MSIRKHEKATTPCISAATRDRTRDLQIFSLTLSQLSYRGATTQICPTSPVCFAHTRSLSHVLCDHISTVSLFLCPGYPIWSFKVPVHDRTATNRLPPVCRDMYRHLRRSDACMHRINIRFRQYEPYRHITATTPAVKIVHEA